jgi:hypothetical protein
MIFIPVISVVSLILVGLAKKSKKSKTPITDPQRQADKIITVILPTINNKWR